MHALTPLDVVTLLALLWCCYPGACGILLLAKVAPKPKREPSSRLIQRIRDLRRPVLWVLLTLAGTFLAATAEASLTADTDEEAAQALENLGLLMLEIAQVLLLYVGTVVGAAVWQASRSLQQLGQLEAVLPRYARRRPSELAAAVVLLTLTPSAVAVLLRS